MPPPTVPARIPIARYAILIAVCWTVTLAASLAWNLRQGEAAVLKVAIGEANAAIEKDFAYRSWATKHGGVYVPVTAQSLPNPYLAHLPNRDLRASDGRELTLINPAYMMRQVAETNGGRLRHAGHLTSLKPLRPENAPDEWEAKALRTFEGGTVTVSEVATIRGAPYLRVMRRFDTEPGCLKCHAHQGYRVGDVRGGLSISIPLASVLQAESEQTRSLVAWHALIWGLGVAALAIGTRRFSRRVREHDRAQDALVETTARLEKSERGLRDAQRLARIGSWDVDLRTGAHVWSDETYRILELDPGTTQASREAFHAVVHPADRDLVRREGIECVQQRRPYDVSHRLLLRDGHVSHVRAHGETVSDGTGRALRIIGTIQDVTEQRKLEEQLRHVQKMEAVGRLAGGVAHDFNNIVTVIQSFGRFLLETFPAGDERRSDAEEIIKAGDRAASLTRQLLAFSRRTVTEPTVIDLNEIVSETERMVRRIVGEDVEVRVELGRDLRKVRVDVTHVEQVLTNLVVNARDAMKRGGRLTIETSNVDVAEEYRAEGPPGAYVLLAVSDTGEGMTPEVREHAFEPFFTTKKELGTGLGLATVYGIVKQAGGFIHLYSEPGQGTTFRIYLPCHDPSATAHDAVPGRASAVPHLAGRSVLLVEDEAPLRDAVRRILEKHGFTVTAAASGDEALAIAAGSASRIDLVLTDVVMPRVNGPQLGAELRNLRPGVPVLFMSGYTESAMQHRAGLAEHAHFVAKPFPPEELIRKIWELLPGAERVGGE